jgi:hypothetical protein
MDKPVGPDGEQSRRAARERTFRRYTHINKQLLEELYYTQMLSTGDIARQLGVCRNVIWEYMEMYGLERRRPGQAGSLKSRHHTFDERYFQQIDQDDKAYIVGLILGDGMLNDRGKAKRLRIDLVESDSYLLEQIASLLGDITLVRHIPRANEREQPKAQLVVNSTRMVEDLMAAGIPLGRKSGHEPFIRFSSDVLTWSFIRGVFDADGHIGISEQGKPRWSIACGIPFVTGLKQFLAEQEIVLSPKAVSVVPGTGHITSANRNNIRRIGLGMYQYGSLWLLRKKRIFDALV